jgi:hypothetical protein
MADGRTRTGPERQLDNVEARLRDAITTLSGMVVDCTREMRPDELSEVESRRVTALGYLREAWIEAGLEADEEWWARQNFHGAALGRGE